MGMLHEGHKSLIRLAAVRSSSIIVFIYVSPTQLATAEERAKYLLVTEADVAALQRLDEEWHRGDHEPDRIKGVFAPKDKETCPYTDVTDISNRLGSYVTISPLAQRLREQIGHSISSV